MTAALVNWFWSLASPDMALVIGLGLITLGIVLGLLRKWGNWT